jgi:hypothetical protein
MTMENNTEQKHCSFENCKEYTLCPDFCMHPNPSPMDNKEKPLTLQHFLQNRIRWAFRDALK